jgi:hypothetical protein
VTGERSSQAGWLGPSQAGSQGPGAEAGFTSSSDGARALSVTREGTWRRGRIRSHSEPDQVTQAGFGLGRIAVTQRVTVATVHQHGRTTRAFPLTRDQPDERRRKAGQSERSNRKGHAVSAGSVKTFRKSAMLKTAPLDCERKSNLREKRRDPWHRANVPTKSGADPALSGQDAEMNSQTCLDLVCRPVAQPSAEAS